jgi:hypothetical protein
MSQSCYSLRRPLRKSNRDKFTINRNCTSVAFVAKRKTIILQQWKTTNSLPTGKKKH